MKRRRFVHPQARHGARLELSAGDLRHAARVLRLKPGTVVEVVDGAGGLYVATYTGAEPPQLVVGEGSSPRARSGTEAGRALAREEPVPLTVGLATVKGTRMDWVAEKLSELGVRSLVPLETARGVGTPRVDRLRRIAREAAKQCGRATLLEVRDPMTLGALAEAHAPDAVRLLLDPEGAPLRVADVAGTGEVVLLVGPEGGFTDDERAHARSLGFRPVRVAGPILRTETAAVAGAVAVLVLRATQDTGA